METIQYHHIKNNCLNTSTISNGSVDNNDNSLLNTTTNSNCSSSSGSCTSMNGIGVINNTINNANIINNNSISESELNASFNDYISKTNLIVNYLPQNMTQDEIKQLFSSIGPVESCKLVKDKLCDSYEAQSLGYAFVNFQKPDDATKAINNLNGMRLQNKTIKVSYARPSSETIKGANLYICGLRLEVTQSELEGYFAPYGTIISSKILTDPKSGASKGVGFVRFDQRMEAEVAIEKLNGSIPEGNTEPITVKFANSPATAKSVIGLPLAPYIPTCRGFYQPYRSTTNPNFRYSPISTYCAPDPTIQLHQTIPTPLSTPTSINLANVLTAPIAAPAPATLQSAATTTSISNPSLSSASIQAAVYSGWCIFVYNLGPEADENILWQLFGPFGAVQSVKISRDNQSQKCKGFGFVTMTNYEEAILAIKHLNGYNLNSRTLQVSFKTNNKLFY